MNAENGKHNKRTNFVFPIEINCISLKCLNFIIKCASDLQYHASRCKFRRIGAGYWILKMTFQSC